MRASEHQTKPRHCRGLSLIELLVALAITAMLLTATMLAIDASFQAYAAAADSAATRTTTRLVVHRVLSLIRTSTAHGPLTPNPSQGVTIDRTTDQDTLQSRYLTLTDENDTLLRIRYQDDGNRLIIKRDKDRNGALADNTAQPLLGGVINCQFLLHRRLNSEGILVLDRASIDFTVQSDDDATLELEQSAKQTLHIVASTMPRKLE